MLENAARRGKDGGQARNYSQNCLVAEVFRQDKTARFKRQKKAASSRVRRNESATTHSFQLNSEPVRPCVRYCRLVSQKKRTVREAERAPA